MGGSWTNKLIVDGFLVWITILTIRLVGSVPVARDIKQSISLSNPWHRSYSQGDHFNLSCTVIGLKRGQHIIFVRLIDDTDYVISNGSRLSGEAAPTRRYHVSIVRLNDTTISTLHISDLNSEDGGRLGCKVDPDKFGMTAYTNKEVTIFVPIYAIKVSHLLNGSYTAVPDGGTVHMSNTYIRIKSGIKCEITVQGGNIKPKVDVYLRGVRITQRFHISTQKALDRTGSFLKKSYTVTMVYETYQPRISDNAQALECHAKVPVYDRKKVTVMLNVTYPPIFDCPDKVYTPEDVDKVITCNVTMNPMPRHAIWWWRQGPSEEYLPTQIHRGSLITEEKFLSRTTIQYVLRIATVRFDHFRNYVLEIDNGMGLKKWVIGLLLGDPDRSLTLHTNWNFFVVLVCLATGYITHGYGYL